MCSGLFKKQTVQVPVASTAVTDNTPKTAPEAPTTVKKEVVKTPDPTPTQAVTPITDVGNDADKKETEKQKKKKGYKATRGDDGRQVLTDEATAGNKTTLG